MSWEELGLRVFAALVLFDIVFLVVYTAISLWRKRHRD